MKKLALVILVHLMIIPTAIYGQKDFTKIGVQDNVSFYYRLKPSKFLKKESPLILLIKVVNENDIDVSARFTVDYYWNSIHKASSEEQFFLLKKNKSGIGKIKRLGFDQADFTNEQLLSENFTIELNDIIVKKELITTEN